MGHAAPCHAPPLHSSCAVSYQPLIHVVSMVKMVMADARTYTARNGSSLRRTPRKAPQTAETEKKNVAGLSGSVAVIKRRRGCGSRRIILPDSMNLTHVESKTIR